MRFRVKAADREGHDHEFVVEASSEKAAASTIRGRGFFPFEVSEAPLGLATLLAPEPVSEPSLAEPEPAAAPTTSATGGKRAAKRIVACSECGMCSEVIVDPEKWTVG